VGYFVMAPLENVEGEKKFANEVKTNGEKDHLTDENHRKKGDPGRKKEGGKKKTLMANKHHPEGLRNQSFLKTGGDEPKKTYLLYQGKLLPGTKSLTRGEGGVLKRKGTGKGRKLKRETHKMGRKKAKKDTGRSQRNWTFLWLAVQDFFEEKKVDKRYTKGGAS